MISTMTKNILLLVLCELPYMVMLVVLLLSFKNAPGSERLIDMDYDDEQTTTRWLKDTQD